MKKIILVVLIYSLLFACGKKQSEPERLTEDGVEVVLNRLEPYTLKGEPFSLYLEEIFKIDTEREDIAETGLTEIWRFDTDSEGNIYLMSYMTRDYAVFKFDQDGNYIKAFGRKGQGPGEVSGATMVRVNSRDNVIIVDGVNKKIITFDRNGDFIKETPIDPSLFEVNPLENGRYLIKKRQTEQEETSEYIAQDSLILCNAKFEKIKEIEREKIPNISTITRFRPMFSVFYSVANRRIYIGNSERDYEIRIFDLEGNLLKKIKKEYQPVVVPEEFKKKLKEFLAKVGRKISFPDRFPPFQYLFTDDQGRLFVMTYEKAEQSKEYIYDIFNPDGIFVGRMSLPNYGYLEYIRDQGPLDVKAANNRFYCVREKENGYKELVVYQMNWE